MYYRIKSSWGNTITEESDSPYTDLAADEVQTEYENFFPGPFPTYLWKWDFDHDIPVNNDSEIYVKYAKSGFEHFKIFEVLDEKTQKTMSPAVAPVNIDYNILGLFKKRYMIRGELIKTEYYREFDFETQTYEDLVLDEIRDYYRNPTGFVYMRRQRSRYYFTDGTLGYTNIHFKFYPVDESLSSGVVRRQNVIDGVKLTIIGLISLTEGIADSEQAQAIGLSFLRTISDEVYQFVQGDDLILLNTIAAYSNPEHTWLNNDSIVAPGVPVRHIILNELTLDYFSDSIYENFVEAGEIT